MACVSPPVSPLLHAHDAPDVNEHCLSVLVLGVQQEEFYAVEDFAVGRSVEVGDDFACAFVQVIESLLDRPTPTPA